MEGAGREVSLRYSAAEVGMRVGDWILGNREEKVSEQLTWFSGRCLDNLLLPNYFPS